MITAAPLLKPELYSAAESPAAAGSPCLLKGGRRLCGYTFFPMQRYGCEDCGAPGEYLQPCDLRGAGSVLAAAQVHVHKGEGREAPFVVLSVRLDDGPVVRSLLEACPETLPSPGSRVEAVLVPPSPEEQVLDLRFRLAGARAQAGAAQ